MKNLKKLNRQELKSLSGGRRDCLDNLVGTFPVVPCCKSNEYLCNNVCIPIGQPCVVNPN